MRNSENIVGIYSIKALMPFSVYREKIIMNLEPQLTCQNENNFYTSLMIYIKKYIKFIVISSFHTYWVVFFLLIISYTLNRISDKIIDFHYFSYYLRTQIVISDTFKHVSIWGSFQIVEWCLTSLIRDTRLQNECGRLLTFQNSWLLFFELA